VKPIAKQRKGCYRKEQAVSLVFIKGYAEWASVRSFISTFPFHFSIRLLARREGGKKRKRSKRKELFKGRQLYDTSCASFLVLPSNLEIVLVVIQLISFYHKLNTLFLLYNNYFLNRSSSRL